MSTLDDLEVSTENSFDVDPASLEAKGLAAIAQDEGFESIDSLVEHFHVSSVMPGFCMHCTALTTRCEPDMREGWCHDCGGQDVKSVLVLVGFC
jgi:hypothetical protein